MFILSGNGIYGVIPIHCCSKARWRGRLYIWIGCQFWLLFDIVWLGAAQVKPFYFNILGLIYVDLIDVCETQQRV